MLSSIATHKIYFKIACLVSLLLKGQKKNPSPTKGQSLNTLKY